MQLSELVKHDEWPSGMTLWFTGLSGAGKTTLCRAVADFLRAEGFPVAVLDGDEVRQTICAGLGYSRDDREENVRRIIMAAEGLVESGVVTLVAAISPYQGMRDEARKDSPASSKSTSTHPSPPASIAIPKASTAAHLWVRSPPSPASAIHTSRPSPRGRVQHRSRNHRPVRS